VAPVTSSHAGAVAQRKQAAGGARQPRVGAGVAAGQAVDRRQVIGIEAMPRPEHKGQKAKRGPGGGKLIHGIGVTPTTGNGNNVP